MLLLDYHSPTTCPGRPDPPWPPGDGHDAWLLERWRRHDDQGAFHALYGKYHDRLCRHARYRLVGHFTRSSRADVAQLASDLAVDALMRARTSTYHPARGQLSTYLFTIVNNLIFDLQRNARRRVPERLCSELTGRDDDTPFETTLAARAESGLAAQETLEQLHAFCESLPERDRDIFMLWLQACESGETLILQDIADRVGVSVATVSRSLTRSRTAAYALSEGPT